MEGLWRVHEAQLVIHGGSLERHRGRHGASWGATCRVISRRIHGGPLAGPWCVHGGSAEGLWRVQAGSIEGPGRVHEESMEGQWHVHRGHHLGCVEGLWMVHDAPMAGS